MIGLCDECGGCNAERCPCLSRCTCPASIREAARTAFQAGQQRAGFGVTAAGAIRADTPRVVNDTPVQPRAWTVTMRDGTTYTSPADTQPDARQTPWVTPGEDYGDDTPSTLAEQVGALIPYMKRAGDDVLLGYLAKGDDVDDTLRLAGQRIVTGHSEHGCNLFTMSDDELTQNLAEEFADALVYRAEQLRREAQAVA